MSVEDVVIVGAGPYGLALAAHLGAVRKAVVHVGHSMELWRTAMPRGMSLKSQGFATNISDPARRDTLQAFCQERGLAYARHVPVPLTTFVEYGSWFQQVHAPDLVQANATEIRQDAGRFTVTLDHGEEVVARQVVVAVGVQHFAYTPGPLARLPRELAPHVSDRPDLESLRDHKVAVVGGGQSALESAALLHEAGADVTLISRRPALAWNQPPAPAPSALGRLRQPEAQLGFGWLAWLYSTQPHLLHRMPEQWRVRTARTALGPAGAHWLRGRVEGRVTVLLGQRVAKARPEGDGIRLELCGEGGTQQTLDVDVVLSATGYRPSLHRLGFLDEELRYAVRTVGAAPAVGHDFQSSVRGLYFAGPAVASSFGPLMRFVCGTSYAAPALAAALTEARSRRYSLNARRGSGEPSPASPTGSGLATVASARHEGDAAAEAHDVWAAQ